LLTFDDGPHPEITPLVLKRLESYQARAVFFTVGRRIVKAPLTLKSIHEQGHLIGNHTYMHPNTKQPWFFKYWRDLICCQSLIEEHTGERPKLFRPPGGHISLTSLLLPKILGLRTMLWSLDGGDWSCKTPDKAKQIAKYLIERIRPNAIVLLHDDNPNVLIILDMLLPALKARKLDLHSGIEFLNK